MNKIQIKHQNCDPNWTRATFAIVLLPKLVLQTMVEQGITEMPIQVGVAYVHPKDQYVKKTGREKAVEKMNYYDCKLRYVKFRENQRVVFHFDIVVPGTSSSRHSRTLDLGISYIPTSSKTRLEYIIFGDE